MTKYSIEQQTSFTTNAKGTSYLVDTQEGKDLQK